MRQLCFHRFTFSASYNGHCIFIASIIAVYQWYNGYLLCRSYRHDESCGGFYSHITIYYPGLPNLPTSHIVAFRAWHPEVILILFFSLIIVSVKSIPKHPMKNPNISCRSHRYLSDKNSMYNCEFRNNNHSVILSSSSSPLHQSSILVVFPPI